MLDACAVDPCRAPIQSAHTLWIPSPHGSRRLSLDDINNLDEWIARSLVILLFVSDKYFTSWSCQNEIKSTLKWKRPFFLVHEVCTAEALACTDHHHLAQAPTLRRTAYIQQGG